MKRTLLTIASAVALTIAAASFNSCTKQEDAAQGTDKQTQNPEMTQEDVATYNKIMGFKTKVDYIKENPMYKSGEEISVDSAVWYLDAAVNFTHAFGFEPFSEFYTDSVFIEIAVDNGLVSLDDVSAGYFELVDKIRDDIYAQVQDEGKQLYTSSTILTSEENGNIILKTTSVIGSNEATDETPFEEGWMYGERAGSCNDPNIFSDANLEIIQATRDYRSEYIIDVGDNWFAYYTLPEKTIEIISTDAYIGSNGTDLLLNLADITPNDNLHDKLMFYQTDEININWGIECIETDDMNFYYDMMHKVIYDIVPNNADFVADWDGVQGLTFCFLPEIYMPGYFTGTIEDKQQLYNSIKITYRTRRIAMDREYPLPL
ncbi:MAG: hypothetical protein DRJ05_00470 [Bacteroidetes bacterium]|nr:MAG: hypothetical protein DRJ05_00470 [Bacteroidota bacterium]